MHHKSETQHLLVYFFSFVQTQFYVSITNIRVDNGGEFFSIQEFFKQKGTTYKHSCVYIPQQNGVVECKHRHILETTRAFRFQAHFSLYFWAECVSTVVHIIIVCPHHSFLIKLLLSDSMENFLLIHTFEFLGA